MIAVPLLLLLALCRLASSAPLNATVLPDGANASVLSDDGVPMTPGASETPGESSDKLMVNEDGLGMEPGATTSAPEGTSTAATSENPGAMSESARSSHATTSGGLPMTDASSPSSSSAGSVSDQTGTAEESSTAAASESVTPAVSVAMKSNEDLENGDVVTGNDNDKSKVSEDTIKVSESPTISVTDDEKPSDFAKPTTLDDTDVDVSVVKSASVSSDKGLVEIIEKKDDADASEMQMKYIPPLNPMMFVPSKAPQPITEATTEIITKTDASATTVMSVEIVEAEDTKDGLGDKVFENIADSMTTVADTEPMLSSTVSSDVENSSFSDSLLKVAEILKDEIQDVASEAINESEATELSDMSSITTLKTFDATTESVPAVSETSGKETSRVVLMDAGLDESEEASVMTTPKTTAESENNFGVDLSDGNTVSKMEEFTVSAETVTENIKITEMDDLISEDEKAMQSDQIDLKSGSVISDDALSSVDESGKTTTSSTTPPPTELSTANEITSAVTEVVELQSNDSNAEDLEFRAVKIPSNISKAAQPPENAVSIDEEPMDDDDVIVEHSETTLDDSTTAQILTTIRDLLLSLISTTPAPTSPTAQPGTSQSSELDPTDKTPTESLLGIDKSEISEKDDGSEDEDVMEAEPIKLVEDPLEDIMEAQSTTTTSTEVPSTERLPSLQPLQSASLQSEDSRIEEQDIELSTSSSTTVTEDPDASPATTVPDASTREQTFPTPKTTAPEMKTTAPDAGTTFPNKETTVPDLKTTVPDLKTTVPDLKTTVAVLKTTVPDLETTAPDQVVSLTNRYVSGTNRDTVAAVQFLHYHDKASSEQCYKLVNAHWNYATNLTEENKVKQLSQTLQYSLFHKAAWKNATSFAWKSFNDSFLRRWFKSLSVLGTAALPEDKLNELNKLKAEMKNTYSTAKVCPHFAKNAAKRPLREKDCKLALEPDLQRVLTKSRDYDELVHVWKAWRDAAGKPIRHKYLQFVELSNEAARLNGFPDTGDMWREAYESETFQEDLEKLWDQLRPLYEHLHAYVRRRLIGQYGEGRIRPDGPIPAHLFGNMWAQSWVSLLDITQPFADKPSVDVTSVMEAKNMSVLEMFRISEEFFTSLGLKAMPDQFWKHSLMEKPQDREIICHASAWDFCNGRDYRIKQCTDITMEDLITVHHEMGHIQYFLQYARQPNVFREGANPGFHEAIGDVLALSVSTPKHLQSIGLLEEVADDPEGDLNFLLRTALDKVSFLPSGYLIDLWRWGLFSGQIKPEEMNTQWWHLRLKYQGICPPVKRTDADFDPGAKYHVPGNVPYIRYFVSFVIQFQFHKVLCDAAGHTGPLYKCDIYRSREAGQILSQVMELGSSEHWSEAMRIMTGGATGKMDAAPILEYFQPLLRFLEEQNRNETLGWTSEDPTVCP